MKSNTVFLTWNNSRRSMSICARLGVERVVIVGNRSGLARHILGSLATTVFLIRKRPELIWFQFSLALSVILWVYACVRRTARVQLVADIHTKAMRRSGPIGTRWMIQFLKRRALRRCVAVLVTNHENLRYVEEFFGAYALVLPDPLPRMPARATGEAPSLAHADVAFICSFAEDEPISLMIEAARQLRGEAQIVFTGNPSKIGPAARREIQSVARFTGFLPDEDYWRLLRSAQCIVVLSNEPACLPCGAYESIAVGRRPILVDDLQAHHLFGDLAIYTGLHAQVLASAIRDALGDREYRASSLAQVYEDRWQEIWQHVQRRLGSLGLKQPAAHP
jgi:glycosyltransferase involved in cell wall biosynthesis